MSRPTLAVLVASFLLRFLVAERTAGAATLKVPQQFATIQAAINASAAGDVVLVAKGVYSENVFLTGDVTLIGKPGAIIDGGGIDSAITVGFSSHAVVRRFTVRNTGIEPGILVGLVDDVEVSGCKVDGVNGHGIAVIGATNARIVDNRVTGAGFDGIHLETDYTVVSGNTVLDSAGSSIFVDGTHDTIEDNRCEGAQAPVSVDIENSSLTAGFHVVVGNRLREPGTDQDGIVVTASLCQLIDNAVIGGFVNGINMDPGDDGGVLQGNTVKGSTFRGIHVDAAQVFVAANRVSGSADVGISIQDDEVHAYRNVVKQTAGIGFEIGGDSDGCVLVQNSASASGTFDLVDDGDGTVLVDNDFATFGP